ncbi:hypothetical protein ACSBR1_032143 [Camellia fascicularis]
MKGGKFAIVGVFGIFLIATVIGVIVVGVNIKSFSDGGSGRNNSDDLSTSSKSVAFICSYTDYKKTYVSSLDTVANNQSATPQDFLQAAINFTMHVVKVALGNTSEIRKVANDSYHKMAMEDFQDLLQYAIDELQAFFSMVGNQPELKKTMSDGLFNATQLTNNALSIVSAISQLLAVFDINLDTSASSRRLLEALSKAAIGDGFIAKSMGFQNTAGAEGHQAVAFRVQSDMLAFYNCRMNGYQDTFYVQAHRQFYRNCVVSSTVDFIFSDAFVVIQNSLIVVRKPMDNQQNIVTAHGRITTKEITSVVIQNCRIVPKDKLYPVRFQIPTYLGRPWKEYSRAVIMESTLADLSNQQGGCPGLRPLLWTPVTSLSTQTKARVPLPLRGSTGRVSRSFMVTQFNRASNDWDMEFVGALLRRFRGYHGVKTFDVFLASLFYISFWKTRGFLFGRQGVHIFLEKEHAVLKLQVSLFWILDLEKFVE